MQSGQEIHQTYSTALQPTTGEECQQKQRLNDVMQQTDLMLPIGT